MLTLHGTIVRSTLIPATPTQTFRAFSDLEVRRRWFRIPGHDPNGIHELDFRIGGTEHVRGSFSPLEHPELLDFALRFLDIVLDRRVVSTFEFRLDDRLRGVFLQTFELTPEGDGTRLDYTDQYAFIDPPGDGAADVAEREGSSRLMITGIRVAVEKSLSA
ncbi:SRPBCC family protein [soil metagenome]